jgi:hypothetical protein
MHSMYSSSVDWVARWRMWWTCRKKEQCFGERLQDGDIVLHDPRFYSVLKEPSSSAQTNKLGSIGCTLPHRYTRQVQIRGQKGELLRCTCPLLSWWSRRKVSITQKWLHLRKSEGTFSRTMIRYHHFRQWGDQYDVFMPKETSGMTSISLVNAQPPFQ